MWYWSLLFLPLVSGCYFVNPNSNDQFLGCQTNYTTKYSINSTNYDQASLFINYFNVGSRIKLYSDVKSNFQLQYTDQYTCTDHLISAGKVIFELIIERSNTTIESCNSSVVEFIKCGNGRLDQGEECDSVSACESCSCSSNHWSSLGLNRCNKISNIIQSNQSVTIKSGDITNTDIKLNGNLTVIDNIKIDSKTTITADCVTGKLNYYPTSSSLTTHTVVTYKCDTKPNINVLQTGCYSIQQNTKRSNGLNKLQITFNSQYNWIQTYKQCQTNNKVGCECKSATAKLASIISFSIVIVLSITFIIVASQVKSVGKRVFPWRYRDRNIK